MHFYSDHDFENNNLSWLESMRRHIVSPFCLGILAFFSPNYITSYATLLEILVSQTKQAATFSLDDKPKEIIPVYIGGSSFKQYKKVKINSFENVCGMRESEWNMFESCLDDRCRGANQRMFDEAIKPLSSVSAKKDYGRLTWGDIFSVFRDLEEVIAKNKNIYSGNTESICRQLQKTIESVERNIKTDYENNGPKYKYNSIFSKENDKNVEPVQKLVQPPVSQPVQPPVSQPVQPSVSQPVQPSVGQGSGGYPDAVNSRLIFTSPENGPSIGTLSLMEFVKKYSEKNFKKNLFGEVSFEAVDNEGRRLPEYDVRGETSTATVAWEVLNRIIRRGGEHYIVFVNQKNKGVKNPVFIPKKDKSKYTLSYKATEEIPNWFMCTNFSQYGWMAILKKRLVELEELTEEPDTQEWTTGEPETEKLSEGGQEQGENSTNEISFSVYGEQDKGNQSDLMIIAFGKILKNHPEIIDEAVKSFSCLSDIAYDDMDTSKRPNSFRICHTLEIQGKTVCIGTAYSMKDKLRFMAKIIQLAGEEQDILKIEGYELPKQSRKRSAGDEQYSIFGEEFSGNQSEMMWDVFQALTERYPEQIPACTQLTSVAKAKNVMNPGANGASPIYFRVARSFDVDGQKYYVGTAYSRKDKLVQIRKMLQICGAPEDAFSLEGEELPQASGSLKKKKKTYTI